MVEKFQSLEKRMDQLDDKIMKSPGKILEQYDLAVFNQKMMYDKLWAKVDRQEALLMRVVGFGQTLKDIAYIQTEIASDVKLIMGEIDFGDENAEREVQENGVGAVPVPVRESVMGSGSVMEPETEPEREPEPETLGPAKLTDLSISGPETLVRDDMEQVVDGPTMGETVATPIIAPSPDVTMTNPTPKNSQDEVQETTTLVTATDNHLPPLIANPGLSLSIADLISTGRLLPPVVGNIGLPPSIADSTSTGGHLVRSFPNAGLPPGVTPPPADNAPDDSPPPTKQDSVDGSTRSDVESDLRLPPPANDHLSPPASVEEENPKGKKKKGRTPNIQDRRSPRLRVNSRAATPAAGGSGKRPADDDEGVDLKRKKAKHS
jgi:hypothetical protein